MYVILTVSVLLADVDDENNRSDKNNANDGVISYDM
jgi:hypothetical protein